MDEKIKIAIVGMGDAFKRYYEEVLNETYSNNTNYEIYCADKKSEHWTEKQIDLRDEIIKKGFKFVDVADLDDERVNKLKPFSEWIQDEKFTLILIGVPDKFHVQSILEWIPSEFSRIIVEKPFSDTSEKIDDLLNHSDKNKIDHVAGFSHVRAKIHEHFKDYNFLRSIFSQKALGNLTKFRFFYLEDYSGTDTKYIEKSIDEGKKIDPDRMCPVLIPGRKEALEKGIVFDLGIHMLSILDYFGQPSTLDIESIWAGKYVGIDNDDSKELDIDGETFAAIDFGFKDHKGNHVQGQTFLGKGILGINADNDFDLHLVKSELGEVKLFELEGETGLKIQFFFNRRREEDKSEVLRVLSADGILLEDHDIQFSLEEKPYFYIFEKALEKPKSNNIPEELLVEEESLFFAVDVAQSHLKKLEEIKQKIKEGIKERGGKYPYYKLGRKENGEIVRTSELLHEIMDRFEPIWKKPENLIIE